ncbi:hypothetical protein Slala03_75840 [Streptomyces lavendulae subsp. lavendulae]|uniref:hypothetical protein n=1 Tax=Streptomyces lavendulae TaxID=1914 RepID=UPI0024A247CC|nr:hypothetical protein [Streptomyces lavendulae]GLV87895.1 hypothetical protein Slala03_75840 [Streptomyces lavendulae subsp. lavendulae]
MTEERPAYYELGYGEDFGLTGLAGRLDQAGQEITLATALGYAEEIAAQSEGEEAVALGEDARRLLVSELPEQALHTVWLASTQHAFDPVKLGMSIREWLEGISQLSTAQLHRDKHSYTPPPVQPVRNERLCQAAVAAIQVMAPALARASAIPDLVPSLEQVVTGADGDLGMRLFLRALKTHSVPVPHENYRRLLVLGWQFGFPPAVVHDGLSIVWPPVGTSRHGLDDDFGLSRLAMLFTAGWHYRTPRATIEDAVQHYGHERPPGSEAAILLEDTRRILDSGLSDEAISLLWLAATDRGHNIDQSGISGRDWLAQVADVCEEHLVKVAPAYVPSTSAIRSDRGKAVLREVRETAPVAAGTVISPGPLVLQSTAVWNALEQVVNKVDPDLGFRLLLRALKILQLPITEAQYARYEHLSSDFQYNENHLLFSVNHLIQRN